MTRHAYSLIELVAALVASTVIIVGLASTISISTQLLESPINNDSSWRDREIADRLASDLRYATAIQDNDGFGFQITRPNPETGSDQTVTYESYLDGLTRQVSGVPAMVLDSDAPNFRTQVDGYSAPTSVTDEQPVRVRSVSTAASTDVVSSLVIDTPPGCKANDLLLLCVSAKTPSSISFTQSGWQTLYDLSRGGLRMTIAYRFYDVSYSSTTNINADVASAMGGMVLSIENVSTYTYPPISWSMTDGGYALPWSESTKPSPLEASAYTANELNLQIIAAEGHPWPNGSIGLASFVDVGQTDAAASDWFIRNSIAVVVRNDHSPSMSATPRVVYASVGNWLQAGIKLEAAQ